MLLLVVCWNGYIDVVDEFIKIEVDFKLVF